MGKLIFLIGGARSGKSTFAQQLAQKSSKRVAFIATAEALDEEMAKRVENHQKNRPSDWITIEASTGISQKFHNAGVEVDAVIVDCLTLLVSNHIMISMNNDRIDITVLENSIKQEIDNLISTAKSGNLVWIVVANEVGMGIVPGDPTSRVYRDVLGNVNRWMAAAADEVFYMVAGIPVPVHQFRL